MADRTKVMVWDWKESPDMEELGRTVLNFSDGAVHMYEVDTQSDCFALVITTKEMTPEEVLQAYEDDE